MSIKTTFIFVICVYAVSFAQVDKKYSTLAARKAFFTEFSKKFNSATVQDIWNSDAKNHFEEFVEGHTEYELIEEYSTIIHELLHYRNKYESNGQHFFVEQGISIFVPFTKLYNSKEVNKMVRKGVQDSIARYGLYVGGKQYTGIQNGVKVEVNKNGVKELSSITDGIYGMLDEFCAYYFGCLAAFETEKYYKSINDNNKDPMYDYSHDVMGDAVAYYEFNLFIAWYLNYAKKYHPEMYVEFHQNKALKVVYTLIDTKFKNLVDQASIKCIPYLQEIDDEDDKEFLEFLKLKFDGSWEDLQQFYAIIAVDEPELFTKQQKTIQGKTQTVLVLIDKEDEKDLREEYNDLAKEMKEYKSSVSQLGFSDNMEIFFSQPTKQIEYLKKQFTSEVNEELNKLRIQGVTSSNYATFLK
jgi:hypothetical protein